MSDLRERMEWNYSHWQGIFTIVDCVTHINPIIALEYKNLITLIENKQIYGIILQIKDIYEIIIRIPVLIMSAFALHNRQAC